MAGGRWPNCVGAVRKFGIMCLPLLVVGGAGNPDGGAGEGGAGARGVLSTFYVLIEPVLDSS